MNRDETIALFERCEAARAEAKKAALAEGKPEHEARNIAHEAAKAIWNGWAEELLAERKAMEEYGRWEKESARWRNDAKADFTRIHFLVAGDEGTEADAGEVKQDSSSGIPPVKTISIEDGIVNFKGFKFPGDADFRSASFSRTALFYRATFVSSARFDHTSFHDHASFDVVHFSDIAFFKAAVFLNTAIFSHVKFSGFARFDAAKFHGSADFYAIRVERGFSMAEAQFAAVPNFVQGHFEEAPQLDNVTVEGKSLAPPAADDPENPPRWFMRQHCKLQRRFYRYRRVTMTDSNIPARWRALKRLAIQAHDQDREHEFFARETRSNRFLHDWPWPAPPWKLEGWFSFARFWAGCAYGLFSNYGRSVLLPFVWWLAGLAIATLFYFNEIPRVAALRSGLEISGASGLGAYFEAARWSWTEPQPCFRQFKRSGKSGDIIVTGLSDKFRAQTDAWQEAKQLALRDGFLILYGDADTAHRTYGCLYGVELYGGGTPVAIVPPQVAFWSAVHKLYSAVMIFLFGLALRNMLKMK